MAEQEAENTKRKRTDNPSVNTRNQYVKYELYVPVEYMTEDGEVEHEEETAFLMIIPYGETFRSWFTPERLKMTKIESVDNIKKLYYYISGSKWRGLSCNVELDYPAIPDPEVTTLRVSLHRPIRYQVDEMTEEELVQSELKLKGFIDSKRFILNNKKEAPCREGAFDEDDEADENVDWSELINFSVAVGREYYHDDDQDLHTYYTFYGTQDFCGKTLRHAITKGDHLKFMGVRSLLDIRNILDVTPRKDGSDAVRHTSLCIHVVKEMGRDEERFLVIELYRPNRFKAYRITGEALEASVKITNHTSD